MTCLHCTKPVFVKKAELCQAHYMKLWRYGDALFVAPEPDMRSKDSRYVNYNCMKNRCLRETDRSYADYGGRGITICDRWLDGKQGFINFMKDMGEKPSPLHTIDRIDHNGNYEPSNCRWATRREQSYNKSNNNEVVGVRFDDKTTGHKKWRSYLRAGKVYVVDYSDTFEEAVEKRKQYERKYVIV